MHTLSDIIGAVFLGQKVAALSDAHGWAILGRTDTTAVGAALDTARADLDAIGAAWGVHLNSFTIAYAARSGGLAFA